MSFSMYDKDTWDRMNKEAESSFGFELYDCKCEVLEALFEKEPELFSDYRWINDESGMPLWVRPGVDWIPQHEIDGDYEY